MFPKSINHNGNKYVVVKLNTTNSEYVFLFYRVPIIVGSKIGYVRSNGEVHSFFRSIVSGEELLDIVTNPTF